MCVAALGFHCCAWAFSSCENRVYSLVMMCGLLTAMASLVEHVLSGPWLQQLWLMSLVAFRYVRFSQTMDRTCVPHTGRCIPNQWTTREALSRFSL